MSTTENLILSAIKQLPKNELDFNVLKREFTVAENKKNVNKKTGLLSKTELLSAYHKMLKEKRITKNKPLETLLMRRAIRTLSGVTIVTSLVKPYPCPGKCVYCPLDVRMPKSYLSDEPAAARALLLEFDPYEQMKRRIEALENNGHPTDKIELIVKGGTWNSYPLSYQYWFILRSFEAANEKRILPSVPSVATEGKSRTPSTAVEGAGGGLALNEKSNLTDLRKELFRQQRINERAKHRIIGLTLETRPDSISEKTIWQMREMGCTRLELGIQHTDDKILKLIKRGHNNEASKKAAELLRNYGFKVDFHLMPQLPGSTPKTDLKMLKSIFDDPGFRPDMIKIYPCTVVKGSELFDWLKAGKFHSYPTKKLVEILKEFKTTVPRYCRISRLIRDIPGQHVQDGNKVTNLRQVIAQEMKKDGLKCRCLRCREIGHADIESIKQEINKARNQDNALAPKFFVDKYETRGGTEYFLSFEDKNRNVVFAFCRLRVCHPERSEGSPDSSKGILRFAQNDREYPAYIRELHTYGQLVKIGKRLENSSQHTGLGKKLMKEAEKIAKKNKVKKIAVISGVGVRGYYRKLGYKLENTYMVKKLG